MSSKNNRRSISYPTFIITVAFALACAGAAIFSVNRLYHSNQVNARAVNQAAKPIQQLPSKPFLGHHRWRHNFLPFCACCATDELFLFPKGTDGETGERHLE
ncbi:MAG: hypothetical protein LBS96_02095 [Oscillospiraceae bacterium]|nr:hypothetical protein [Oscillospiraceae bacterium]